MEPNSNSLQEPLTIARLLLFLQTAKQKDLSDTLGYRLMCDTLSVVEWQETETEDYALKISLKALGNSREEAYIPVRWNNKSKPSVLDLVQYIRR